MSHMHHIFVYFWCLSLEVNSRSSLNERHFHFLATFMAVAHCTQRSGRVKLIIWSYWFPHLPWEILNAPHPPLTHTLHMGGYTGYTSYLKHFEVAASKFNLEHPLTSMASKMTLPNILKEASNQCICSKD